MLNVIPKPESDLTGNRSAELCELAVASWLGGKRFRRSLSSRPKNFDHMNVLLMSLDPAFAPEDVERVRQQPSPFRERETSPDAA